MTRLLEAWRRGDETAFDELLPLVHDELRRIARGDFSAPLPCCAAARP